MNATTWWQIAIGGMSGPLLVELAKAAKWSSVHRMRSHWRLPLYWISFSAFVVLGGGIAVLLLYGDGASVPITRAVHIGATAPLIVSAWASGDLPSNAESKANQRLGGIVPGEVSGKELSIWDLLRQASRW